MKPVLFTSSRSLERAENICAIFNGFDGEKDFERLNRSRTNDKLKTDNYALIVTDEVVLEAHCPVILVGHGISGCKKSYLDQEQPYVKDSELKLISDVITTSPEMTYISAMQCGVNLNQVHSLGMPRTDYYIGKKKGDGHTGLKYKRAYLYVPTYRGKTDPSYPELDLDYINSNLENNEVFVIKPHMLMDSIAKKSYDHIIEVSPMARSAPYLIDCDVVITDYSSIMLDGYLLKKPCVLFEKNLGYINSRGMYLDYPYEYSSRYVTNEADLIEALRNAKGLTDVEKRCIEKTAASCDGNSTKRVCEFISRKLQRL